MAWKTTNYPGVRYREHPTRKHGVGRDKYFVIRIPLGEGKRKEEPLGWASEGWTAAKAADRLAELRDNIRQGAGPQSLAEKREIAKAERERQAAEQARSVVENITLAEVWEKYFPIAAAGKAADSMRAEAAYYGKWIAPLLGKKPMRSIVPLDLERLKKKMLDAGKSARTIHYTLAVVRQAFNFAGRHGLFQGENPVSKVRKPREDNRRLRFLNHEQADALLAALAVKSMDVHDMALVSLHCGARAGEVFGLTWGAANLDRMTLVLKDTKNGRTRIVPMTDSVRTMLAGRKPGFPSDLIFPGRGGVKIVQVSETFNRCVAELGFNDGISDRRDKVVFHTCRHTWASWHVAAGTNLIELMELGGWSSLDLVRRYSHADPNGLAAATRRMERAMKTRPGKVLAFER